MDMNRILKADSTCGACDKKADSACMKCFSCDKSWHVHDCSASEDLVTKTFLKNQWNVWKAAGTYKSICFVCPPCRDAKNLQRDIISSNRMSVMEEQVSTVQIDIQEIKNLLKGGQDNANKPPTQPTYAQTVKSSDSVIVIKKDENAEIIERNTIREAAVTSRVGISRAYNNRQGDTIVICEDEAAKERLTTSLRDKVGGRTIVTPAARQPTIRVTGMDEKYNADTVFNNARDLNSEKGIKIDADNFKVLRIHPHAKNPNLFQAIVRVSNDIRTAIQNAGDKLHIGLSVCKIFDHFHIKRCNRCQGYNHFQDKCEREPKCGKCAGDHDTEGCTSVQVKCINCTINEHTDTNHESSAPNCKSYIAAQKKLEQSIGFYKRKN